MLQKNVQDKRIIIGAYFFDATVKASQNTHVKWLVCVCFLYSKGYDSDNDCVHFLLTVLPLLYFVSFMNNGRFYVFRSDVFGILFTKRQ